MTELDLHSLVAQLRRTAYQHKTDQWIRGSLPRSSFRIGSPASERPGPAIDRTDRDVLAELKAYKAHYKAAVDHVAALLHYEHVALDPKPGLEKEAGWPCINWTKRVYGRRCDTSRHDHPHAECVSCRKAKQRQKEANESGPVISGGTALTDA